MSETTKTVNYGLTKPNVNADDDLWGDHLNLDLDTLDTIIHGIDTRPAGGVTSWNTRTGAVTLTSSDVTTALNYTPYNSTNPANYQTGAQVTTALAAYAPLMSPPLVGAPTAPTVTPSTDASNKLATTAFVQSALGAVPGGAVIADAAPALNPGGLWWCSVDGQLYVRFDDGNSQQYVAATNIAGLANAATKTDVATALNNVGRNLIHNSMFNIAQRGAGGFNGTTTGWTYSLDRWALIIAAAGDSFTHGPGAMTDAYRTQVGDESATTDLVCNFTGGAGAANACLTSQFIEGVRRLAGKTVIVSFYALAGASSPKLGVSLDQFFGSGGSPSSTILGTGQSVTVSSATWARYSVTLTLPSISGKALGTAGNDQTSLLFWHSAGANSATRSGSVGVQTGTHLIWGVQLEIAQPGQTQPTPLEKPDPELQLRQCQRFFCASPDYARIVGNTAAGGSFGSVLSFPSQMRATPTVALSGQAYSNASGAVSYSVNAQGTTIRAFAAATGDCSAAFFYTGSADL